MSATANLAQGTKFHVSTNGSTYTPLVLLNRISGFSKSAPSLETTDLDSTASTFLKGIVDNGEISADFRYDSDTTFDMVLANLDAYGASASMYFKLSLAGTTIASTYSGRGFFTAFNIVNETNAVRTGSMTFKVSGALTKA